MVPRRPNRRSLSAAGSAAVLGLVLVLALAIVPAAASGGLTQAPEITYLARDLAGKLAQLQVNEVAVVDFTDLEGRPTELGRYVATELGAALADAGPELRLIDRTRLAALLDEKRLTDSGLIPPEELRAVAKVAGVDALVTGRTTPFADTVRLQAVVLAVTSGEQLAHAEADLPRTPTVQDLEAQALRVVANDVPGGVELEFDGPPRQTVETHGFAVALRGCLQVTGKLHCALAITNRDHERNLYLMGDSRVLTPAGAQLPASRISLGAHVATGSLSRVGVHLLEGFPVAATVSFDGVPEAVRTLRLLEIRAWGFPVQFADVPIER